MQYQPVNSQFSREFPAGKLLAANSSAAIAFTFHDDGDRPGYLLMWTRCKKHDVPPGQAQEAANDHVSCALCRQFLHKMTAPLSFIPPALSVEM
jgi:hypothetical protein